MAQAITGKSTPILWPILVYVEYIRDNPEGLILKILEFFVKR